MENADVGQQLEERTDKQRRMERTAGARSVVNQFGIFLMFSGAYTGSFKHTTRIFEFASAGDWGPESYSSRGMRSALAVHGPPIRPRGLSLPPTLTRTTR